MASNEAGNGRRYQHERHQVIVERARRDNRVEVTSLADELDVTTETIRRDLTALEKQGLLRRVHGGAMLVDRLGFEPSVAARETRLAAEKEQIAAAAVRWLPEGGSILLDGGTSTLALARHIPPQAELAVMTNSLPAATLLAERPGIELHLLGGRIRSRTHVGVGRWSADALADLSVDVAFMGTNGLTLQHGLTTPDLDEAATKRAMIAAARQVVLLADHSKIGASYLGRFATLAEVDVLITDRGLDEETADQIEAAGPRVVFA